MYISIKNIRLASSEPVNKGSSPAASWQENKELGTMAVGALRRSVVTTWETVEVQGVSSHLALQLSVTSQPGLAACPSCPQL